VQYLRLDALTDKDRDDLAFIAKRADMVGYSFVRREADVDRLQQRLAELNAGHLGIILKIETRQAFEELPKLLLACMRTERFGVMIARGDLAIECGYERMAEVQEEMPRRRIRRSSGAHKSWSRWRNLACRRAQR
jgi:pyruvate kinase